MTSTKQKVTVRRRSVAAFRRTWFDAPYSMTLQDGRLYEGASAWGLFRDPACGIWTICEQETGCSITSADVRLKSLNYCQAAQLCRALASRPVTLRCTRKARDGRPPRYSRESLRTLRARIRAHLDEIVGPDNSNVAWLHGIAQHGHASV